MFYGEEDTIAAISTAVSESGIGIIRISGPSAVSITDRIYRSKGGRTKLSDVPSHTIHYGFIVWPEEMEREKAGAEGLRDQERAESWDSGRLGERKPGETERKSQSSILSAGDVIDEVLVSVMRSPRTYTAEDVVEINCHGSALALRRVLEAVIFSGARLAEPGEFTKRAFLNGRIDLSSAEAVMDVIEAKNDLALKNSLKNIRGGVHRKIQSLMEEILYETAHIEAAIDDPEHLSYEEFIPELETKNQKWVSQIQTMIRNAREGILVQEGIHTVIVGKPNAGKSSLMNLLLGHERAIVTEIAGTTRDILTENVTVEGITLVITDTAGIHETDDLVEKIGVKRAIQSLKEADLLLFLIDSSTSMDRDDLEIFSMISDKKVIILLNKSDLPAEIDVERIRKVLQEHLYREEGDTRGKENEIPVIPFSTTEGIGLKELMSQIQEMFFEGTIGSHEESVISNERQFQLLERASESLHQVQESITSGMPEDFFTIDLRSAYEYLGEIIGENVGENLVNEIFSRFCMGK